MKLEIKQFKDNKDKYVVVEKWLGPIFFGTYEECVNYINNF